MKEQGFRDHINTDKAKSKSTCPTLPSTSPSIPSPLRTTGKGNTKWEWSENTKMPRLPWVGPSHAIYYFLIDLPISTYRSLVQRTHILLEKVTSLSHGSRLRKLQERKRGRGREEAKVNVSR